jgi:hypothetical protein
LIIKLVNTRFVGSQYTVGQDFFYLYKKKGVRSTQACFKKVFFKSDSHIDINKQKMLV